MLELVEFEMEGGVGAYELVSMLKDCGSPKSLGLMSWQRHHLTDLSRIRESGGLQLG